MSSIKLPPAAQRAVTPPTTSSTPAARPPVADLPPVVGPNGELLGDDFGLKGDSFKPATPPPASRPTTPSASPTPSRPPVVTTPPPPPPPVVTGPVSGGAPTAPASLTLRQMRPVERLDGGLVLGKDAVPQLNSNHPEIITTLAKGGIAVSTLSPQPGASNNSSRLDHSFNGPFRLFSSNQNRTGSPIHQTVALHNPGSEPITVKVKTFATTTTSEAGYLDTQKDANGKAFVNQESVKEGVHANGPAQRTAARILQGHNEVPASERLVTIPPGGTAVLPSSALPDRNELITQGEFESSGPVQAAIVYNAKPPSLERVKTQLRTEGLLTTSSHDRVPTDPNNPQPGQPFIFGRVAGVAETSTYKGRMSNSEDHTRFLTDVVGEQSFAFNTKQGTDLGTGRVESSPMLARNANAAYASHLNYGAELNLGGTFHNPTDKPKRVRLFIDSPVSSNDSRVLRNVFEVSTRSAPDADPNKRYVTVSQSQQTRGRTPLAEFVVPPGGSYEVDLRALYSANNTGPHAVRVVTDEPAR